LRSFQFIVLALLVACTPTATATPTPDLPMNTLTPGPSPENPYQPRPGDIALQRGHAFVEDAGVSILTGSPAQIHLHLSGNLPDPCHELRIAVSAPDPQNEIAVEVYSLVDPSMICIQVLKPFTADMTLGSYPAGHYTVTVNGEPAGKIDT